MTSKFSIDNRELLQRISSGEAVVGIDFGNLIVRELAAFRLAAMNGEPVAEVCEDYAIRYISNGPAPKEGLRPGDKLYRHAQPAPVAVPDEMPEELLKPLLIKWDEYEFSRLIVQDIWNACRDAMLKAQSDDNGEPTDDERIMAIEGIHNCERCGDEGWVVGEMGITRCACGQAGNSPAQSDCCPAQNGVAPAQSPIDHGYRPECECSGCKSTARICAELSANSSANPDCWCRTCRPVVLNDMRFVVCPDCGNKRCPRANDHRNACTGSNEPGQEDSAYPDTPREVKP